MRRRSKAIQQISDTELREVFAPLVAPDLLPRLVRSIRVLCGDHPPHVRCALVADADSQFLEAQCAIATALGMPDPHEQPKEAVIAEAKRLRDLVSKCPTECDPDCDTDCHEWHKEPFRRTHNPTQCVAAIVGRADRRLVTH